MSIAEKLQTIAENEQKVYEAGKKSEYDEFWDEFQQNGNRVVYNSAFGSCWNNKNFKPKYSIKPNNAYMMFFNNMGAFIKLGECAEDYFRNLGIELDFSNATNVTYALSTLHAKKFKKLDFSNATSMANLFYSHNVPNSDAVEEIDEFVSSEKTTYNDTTFSGATQLKKIIFSADSVIATSINFSASPLSVESMKSIIGALKNYKGTDKEGQCKLTFSQSCWAALHNSGETAPDGSASWTDYVKHVLGWSV